jgi:hypothetical protein
MNQQTQSMGKPQGSKGTGFRRRFEMGNLADA